MCSLAISSHASKLYNDDDNDDDDDIEQAIGADGVGVTCVCPTHIKTELFKGFDNIGASLLPETVATATIEAIESNRQLVLLPSSMVMAVLTKTLFDVFGKLGMPTDIDQKHNAMHKWDSKAADKVFEKMGTAKL